MKTLTRGLIAAVILTVGGAAFGQEPQPVQQPLKYARGHKPLTPDTLHKLKATHPPRDFPDCTLPAYDSRADGKLTPDFRDQGQCGSCWAFSGIRTIAYARLKAGLNPFQLSEQYILDCVPSGGCNGDDNTTVLKAAKAGGIPTDKDYGPYHGSEGQCKYKPDMARIKIDDFVFINGDDGQRVGDRQKIKNAIFATGGVGCAVAAGPSWDGYSSGVHHGRSQNIDHDVVLTGWQDDPNDADGGYWWMDNSWSKVWGIGGRMKIGYKSDSIGTEPVAAICTAVTPPAPVDAPGHTLLIAVASIFGVVLVGGGVVVFIVLKRSQKL